MFCSLSAGRRCLCPEWLGELLIVHHHGQHVCTGLRCACSCSISHRPDGKIADVLALTHACTTANSSVNYSKCVLRRPSKFPIFDGKGADVLALTHACKTANASRSTTGCVCRRDLKNSHRPMGQLLTCLPRFTLARLRTLRSTTTVCTCCRDLQKYPSPRWEHC